MIVHDTKGVLSSPLAVLGLDRGVVHRYKPEQLKRLIDALFRHHSLELHPDKFHLRAAHPNRGGNPKLWPEIEKSWLQRWEKIQSAYQALQDPKKLAFEIARYPALSSLEALNESRSVAETLTKQASSVGRMISRFVIQAGDPKLKTIKNCGPCTIGVIDLAQLLFLSAEDPKVILEVAKRLANGITPHRSLQIAKDGSIKNEPSSRIAATLRIPTTAESITEFLQVVRLAGCRIPSAYYMLPSGSSEATQNSPDYPATGGLIFKALSKNQVGLFTKYLSAQISPSGEKALVLLVSMTKAAKSNNTFTIEGVITNV